MTISKRDRLLTKIAEKERLLAYHTDRHSRFHNRDSKRNIDVTEFDLAILRGNLREMDGLPRWEDD